MNTAPVLVGNEFITLVNSGDPFLGPSVLRLDTTTGKEVNSVQIPLVNFNYDANGMLIVHDPDCNNRVYFAAQSVNGHPDNIVAANPYTGKIMWWKPIKDTVWNFKPATPGDGSVVFSTSCGGAYRIASDGWVMWKHEVADKQAGKRCTPSGGALGPNGVFYAVWAESGSAFGGHGVDGRVAAYRVSDGASLWNRTFPAMRGGQYPAVGKVGPDGRLAVVCALGDNPLPPMNASQEESIMRFKTENEKTLKNYVVALDAETGSTLWQSEEEPWSHLYGAGETEEHNARDGGACFPDAQ